MAHLVLHNYNSLIKMTLMRQYLLLALFSFTVASAMGDDAYDIQVENIDISKDLSSVVFTLKNNSSATVRVARYVEVYTSGLAQRQVRPDVVQPVLILQKPIGGSSVSPSGGVAMAPLKLAPGETREFSMPISLGALSGSKQLVLSTFLLKLNQKLLTNEIINKTGDIWKASETAK